MSNTGLPELIAQLRRNHADLKRQAEQLLCRAQADGRQRLNDIEDRKFRNLLKDARAVAERIADLEDDVRCSGQDKLARFGGSGGADVHARVWAGEVAERLRRSMSGGESRAVVSGSIDVPQLIETAVVPLARPVRLIDLFPNRVALTGNSYEFYQQTARVNTATAVPDFATKPTSTLTVTAVQDRCRVIAHLSEPAPIRLLYDIDAFQSWLVSEMVGGVLDGLEAQIVSGDPGSGTTPTEDMRGLLNTSGVTTVAYDTDLVTTLRSAQTALQTIGVTPTGWALSPEDAQSVDLLRWNTAGGFLSGGYQNDTRTGVSGSSDNIFGPNVPRVVSPSVPTGVAILGDFSKLRVYVREDAHVDIDASGAELFDKNLFKMRGEMRAGIGVLQPQSFAIIDLTP